MSVFREIKNAKSMPNLSVQSSDISAFNKCMDMQKKKVCGNDVTILFSL